MLVERFGVVLFHFVFILLAVTTNRETTDLSWCVVDARVWDSRREESAIEATIFGKLYFTS